MYAVVRIARLRARRFWHHIRRLLSRLRQREHRMVGKVAIASHLSYYGLVYIESHGMYGKAALVCGIILLVEVVVGGGHEE